MTKNILDPIHEYYINPDNALLFGGEVRRAMVEFLGKERPMPEIAFFHFVDWFMFDFPLFGKETPIKNFYRTNPLKYSKEKLLEYEAIERGSLFDFFEIIENKRKNILILKAMHSGGQFEVFEDEAKNLPGKGGVIITRLIPILDHYEIATLDPIAMDKPSSKDLARMKNEFPVSDSRIIYHEIVSQEFQDGNLELEKSLKMDEFGNRRVLITGGNPDADRHENGGDGCPICVLMDKAKKEGRNLTEAELTRAFNQANLEQQNKKKK
ncbi:MAG: hypothetical protein WCT19_01990 [Candidatus Paceibacterota bacterium]|jgi:hypothetical protein